MLRLTRKQSREVDRIAIEEYGIPSIVLMENAARRIAEVAMIESIRLKDHTVIVLCGKGNNGGDGLAAARHLCSIWPNKRDVRVLLSDLPNRFSGDAATQLRIVQKMGLPISPADEFLRDGDPFSGTIIDAVYGTGFRPPSRIDFRGLNDRTRAGGALVVAVDLPSGMDADTGDTDNGNAIVATYTLTMAAQKAGFASPDAAPYLGNVRVVNLLIPPEVLRRAGEWSPG